MSLGEAVLLIGGGLIAGVVNTLAGGGSLLTVPLLVLVGLPGNIANGTNRVGILLQSIAAAWRFRAEGVSGIRSSIPVLVPVALGSVLGAFTISRVADRTFEALFGIVMLLLLVPMLRTTTSARPSKPLSPAVSALLFFGIGLYGGAFQAGVGIFLMFALSYSGYDLVRANSIKVVIISVLTAVAVPVFIAQRQIEWLPAVLLALGFVAGGVLGVRLAIIRGERLIRPVLVAAVIALAGKMIGFY